MCVIFIEMLYQKKCPFVIACKARKMANLQKLLFAENIAIFININIFVIATWLLIR